MSTRLGRIGLVALATLVAMMGFLFSPRVPRGQARANCVSVTDLGPMHIHKNCDSEEFQYIAAHPGLMLSTRPARQNRPLFALMGWALARPFRMLGLQSIGRRVLAGARQTYPKGPSPAEYFPEYAGFVTLNWILLVGAVLVFLGLSRSRGLFDPLTLLPLTMIVVNQVTKAAFWTPHVQIFHVLIPLASIALYKWMIGKDERLGWSNAVLLGFAIGIGALAYGAFAVMAGGAALCVILGEGNQQPQPSFLSRVGKSFVLLVAFLIPTAAWSAFVIHQTGNFYSQEISLNRMFVWTIDALRAGGAGELLRALASKSQGYFNTLRTTVPFAMLVIAILSLCLAAFKRMRATIVGNWQLVLAVTIYAIANLLFFWLLGFYGSRLSWSIVPAMTVLIAIGIRSLDGALNPRGRRILRVASVGAAILYAAYWYTVPGPWS